MTAPLFRAMPPTRPREDGTLQPIIRGFRNLLVFDGRDVRAQFWPYAAVVVALTFMIMGGTLNLAVQSFFAEAERMAVEHPDSVQIQQTASSYSVQYAPGSGVMPDMTGFFLSLGGGVLLAVVLLAAAITRRLHDRGLPGYFALVPLTFLGLGVSGMHQMMMSFDEAAPDLALFGALMLNNMLYLASLAGLVIALSLPGSPVPNRYGASPTSTQ